MWVIVWLSEMYEDLNKSETSVAIYRQSGWITVMTVSLGEVIMLKRNKVK